MSEHTPGPWIYSGGYPAFVAAPDKDDPGNALKAMVCALDNPLESYHRPSNEVNANGWLIAAAPDLYEAAKAMLLSEDMPTREVWELLEQAVAKAKGRENV